MLLFQFHKGTIRTLDDEVKKAKDSDFNSIKVRLEHSKLKDTVFDLSVFQFHKGTIRTSDASHR